MKIPKLFDSPSSAKLSFEFINTRQRLINARFLLKLLQDNDLDFNDISSILSLKLTRAEVSQLLSEVVNK